MIKIEPQSIIDHKAEIIKELSQTVRGADLIDIITLGGTSTCGEATYVVSVARKGVRLYPGTPNGLMFPAISDRGETVGYLSASPVLAYGINNNLGVYMTVEYSSDSDGVPEIICSVWVE